MRLAAATLAAALAATPAIAQDWPGREPIRMIVCAPGGSTVDLTARLWADAIRERIGNPAIVVEPRAGAGGMIGAEAVARAPADGHTLLVCFPGSFTMIPHLRRNLPIDPLHDLRPLALLATAPFVFVADARVARTLPEFIAKAKAPGADLSYASVGPGSLAHLGMELFKQRTGAPLVHVPYRGSPEAITDLLGGRVAAFITLLSAVQGHVAEGRLAALFVTGETRMSALPEVPTAREAGLPDLTVLTWHGLFVPRATPEPVVQRIAAVLAAARSSAALREGLARAGSDLPSLGPAEAEAHIRAESATWKRVIEAAGITAQ
ncbi:tripartite tricarboxylate transporter substrate binding protein [Elioraea sp.]|uniref:Bug family tripartite tricarboxylate transporter substrate binding protein n=1 Tax=Elioraea sp. TaxID=2185103 RepID=UPI0021DD194D|nr:tripartite tricarboxylate transporter substrate binding protein [Elioraea sp.]GIX08915.1 MAG: exported protein [Elioraea sp.]